MQEKEELLNSVIENAQKTIEQSKDWHVKYDKQVNAMLDSRPLLDQFKIKRLTKEYSALQFYLNEITQPDLITITAKYKGNGIATITITKDTAQISTETYEKSNKELFNIDTKLKNEDLNTIQTHKFLEHFNQDIKLKTKPNRETQESMLLAEFSKTSSYDKLLTGIQPIKYADTLYYQIPMTIGANPTEYINILARTKVRKITLVEVLEDGQDLDTILAQATAKAVFLINLLHTENGASTYRLMGFHGRLPNQITIKVCIAVPKSSKIKEFEPFQIQNGIDTLDYRYLQYENDQEQITSIKTNVND